MAVAVRLSELFSFVSFGDFLSSLEERSEDGFGLLVVIVNDVHQVMRVHDVQDRLACL